MTPTGSARVTEVDQRELAQLVAAASDVGVFNRTVGTPNVIKMAALVAGLETADYYTRRALTAEPFDTKEALMDHAVGAATLDGHVLEFGVGSGGGLRRLAALADHGVGFDSFEGLPEDWRGRHRRLWQHQPLRQQSLLPPQ